MKFKDMINTMADKFKCKMNEICSQIEEGGQLTSELASSVERKFGEVAMEAARFGFKKFIESFDVDEASLNFQGEVYRNKLCSSKEIFTMLGKMQIERTLYQKDRGGKAYAPVDTAWGMVGESVTPAVKESVLFTVAHVTPKEVEAILKQSAWFHPSASLIKRLTEDVGEFIEENEEVLLESVRVQEEEPEGVKCLSVSLDGVNVLLNEPGPRKGRPQERPASAKKVEGRTSYRNAMVGSISFYGEVPEDKHSPERLHSRYVAHMPEKKFPTFKSRFEAEFLQAESMLGSEVHKVLLVDAHKGIWGYEKASGLFRDYHKAVDFYHTTEHLSKAAEALFGKNSKEGKRWYKKWRGKLLEEDDAGKRVFRSICYLLKVRKISRGQQEIAKKEMTFFRRNWRYMPYAEFLRRGFPIGSGVVEAACKSIVKTRMCRSGMRWSRKGGQHILHLRTIVKSGRWKLFWKEYQRLKDVA